MIAWKLTTEFDEEQHLFSNVLKTDYVVNAFTCSCGNIDCIIGYLHDEIKYTCPTCDNRTFYDANSAWRNIKYFLSHNKNIELNYCFDIFTCKESIEARYITMIPESIDYMRKKVFFARKKLYGLNISDKGYVEETSGLFNVDISKELKRIIENRLNKKPNHFNLPTSENEPLNINSASFFLKNKNLTDYDFCHWVDTQALTAKNMTIEKAFKIITNYRKEKLVKKVIYRNYCRQKRDSNKFSSTLIEVFTKEIKDPNILVQLLQLEIYDTYFDKYYITKFIQILKKKYTDKQILALFIQYDSYAKEYFNDMIRSLSKIEDMEDFFKTKKKIKCNISSLHDAATTYQRKLLAKD